MRSSDITELIAFASVAEHKSFRRAAERLNLTPSTLSHSLRALEERLGLRLLNQTTRSIGLTDAGAALLAQVRPALAQLQAATEVAGEAAHGAGAAARGSVRLNVPHLAAEMVFGKRLGAFARAYPGVVLDIATDDSFVDVVGLGYDAGIRVGESLDQDMIAVRVTAPLRNIVVGSPAYLDAHPQPVLQPDDLQAHRCIGYRASGSRRLYKWEFEQGERRVAVAPKGTLILDRHALLVEAALAGRDWRT